MHIRYDENEFYEFLRNHLKFFGILPISHKLNGDYISGQPRCSWLFMPEWKQHFPEFSEKHQEIKYFCDFQVTDAVTWNRKPCKIKHFLAFQVTDEVTWHKKTMVSAKSIVELVVASRKSIRTKQMGWARDARNTRKNKCFATFFMTVEVENVYRFFNSRKPRRSTRAPRGVHLRLNCNPSGTCGFSDKNTVVGLMCYP